MARPSMVVEAVDAALKKAAWVVDRRNRLEPCRVAEEDQIHLIVLAGEVHDLRQEISILKRKNRRKNVKA